MTRRALGAGQRFVHFVGTFAVIRSVAAEPLSPSPPVQAEAEASFALMLPFRQSEQGVALRDEVKLALPVSLGLGARVLDVLYVGAAGSFAPTVSGGAPPKSSICSFAVQGEPCSASIRRLAGVLGYQMVNHSFWEPWLRLAFGYEWVRFHGRAPIIVTTDPNATAPVNGGEFASTLAGWFGELRAGADYSLSPHWRLGPYLGLGAGVYARRDVDEASTSSRLPVVDEDIRARAAHYWLSAGLRGAFVSR